MSFWRNDYVFITFCVYMAGKDPWRLDQTPVVPGPVHYTTGAKHNVLINTWAIPDHRWTPWWIQNTSIKLLGVNKVVPEDVD